MNPFPGLRPFTQEEDYLFFGREEQTLELLQRLATNRFVAVVGTSGSGKSSLVRCGLLSELLGGRMLDAGSSWEIAVTHPGGNPLALLTDALLDADLYDRDVEHVRENLLATLSRSHFGLVEAVKQANLGDGTNFLLVVDQFEEIFRFQDAGQRQQEVANEFVSLLLEAAAQKEVPIYVVLTMRSDFIGECGQFEGLAEMVNRGEFLIPRLTRDQYKRVIEGPIKVAGGQIAPRLLQRLLNDLGQQADQLPCLQHALMRTWNVWAAKGDADALDLDDYQRVGKMSQALSLHADEIYESLATDRQRELCQGIFQALTVEETNSRGIRRPQRLGRLCQILEVSADELRPIIDAYRQSGVTFLMPAPDVELTEQTIIDISHESLMRVWTRLRQWVEEETQAAGIYLRLSESAVLHEQGRAGLYRDPELGIALAWRDAKRPNAAWAERYRPGFAAAIEFLETSRQASVAEGQAREVARQRELEQARQLAEAQRLRLEQQQQAARKLRRLFAGVAVVAVIAAIACVFALVARHEAGRQAEIAAVRAEEARRNAEQAEQERATAEAAEATAQRAEKRSREFRYATDIQLAARLIGDAHANARQVLDRLADHEPASDAHANSNDDLRGFEWHYLKRLVDSRGTIFPTGEPLVTDTVFAAGEGDLVTLNDDGRLQFWDVLTRRAKHSTPDVKKNRNLSAAALSRDGRVVALADDNAKQVHLVDVRTGADVRSPLSAQAIFGLIFSPDGKLLITLDSKITWWDVATGRQIAAEDTKLAEAGPLSISADGLTVAVPGPTWCSAFRLDPGAAKIAVLMDKQSTDMGSPRTAAISPDGRFLFVSQVHTGTVTVFDFSSGRGVKATAFEQASSVSAMGFDPQGTALATACFDGSIKIWPDWRSLATAGSAPQEPMPLIGHRDEITHITFTADGKRVISACRDMTARLWDLGMKVVSVHRTLDGIAGRRACFSPNGLMIATAVLEQGRLRLRDAETGHCVRDLPVTVDAGVYPESVAFSPDNRLLAVGYGGAPNVSYIELWEIDRGERLAVLPGTTDLGDFETTAGGGVVSALSFSPDGKYLAAGFGAIKDLKAGRLGQFPLKIYDVAERRAIRILLGHENYCTAVAFSRDGTQLASGSNDGTARVWDTATWKTRHVLQNPFRGDLQQKIYHDVAFSPSGELLAIASHDGTVQVWNPLSGELLETLRGHANGVTSVAFSPDGRTLASGSYESSVRLWNVATWREVMRLDPEVGVERHSLAFSRDGRHLLATGFPAILWSTRPVDDLPPELVAGQLTALLDARVDFPSWCRARSEIPRWHDTLEILVRQRPNDARVEGAWAAARVHRFVSRQDWKQTAEAFDQLQAVQGHSPAEWFDTAGILRVAKALIRENRFTDAAKLIGGAAGRIDDAGEIKALVNERLAEQAHHPGLLELRAELAGLSSDAQAQVADYTAAIEALDGQTADTALADRQRLFGRRGNAHVALQQWQHAVDDYARGVTAATIDEAVLSNQALALAGVSWDVWTVLKPKEWKAAAGATLTVQDDGSIFVSGDLQANETFTLEFDRLPTAIQTIRLEAVRDDRLPSGGPGTHSSGNFVLSDLTVFGSDESEPAAMKQLSLRAVSATFEERPVATSLAKGEEGWSVYGATGKSHSAIFAIDRPKAEMRIHRLRMVFDFYHPVPAILGRFRISVSNVAAASLPFAASDFTDPWQKLAAAYRIHGNQQAIDALVERRPRLAGKIGDVLIQGQDKDWARAVEIYSQGITAKSTDADLLPKRARAYERLNNWEAAAADWLRVAQGNPNGARLLDDFHQRLLEAGQNQLATTQLDLAQRFLEATLREDPEDSQAIAELAGLLLAQSGTRWITLQPSDLKSDKRTTLTPLRDGSILASGTNSDGDIYTFSAHCPLDRVAAVRLEVLPDSSLPQNGPGRHETGNFHLRSFRLYQSPAHGQVGLQPVPLASATASYAWNAPDVDVAGTIDPSLNKFWHVWGRLGQAHHAVYRLSEPVDVEDRSIVIELRHGYNLGRFRVSVTDALKNTEFVTTKIADPRVRLALAYGRRGEISLAAHWAGKALDDVAQIEARIPLLEPLRELPDLLAELRKTRHDDPALQLTQTRSLVRRSSDKNGQTQEYQSLAELKQAHQEFTELLKTYPAPQWTVLNPTEIKSAGGATLTTLPDGSILASGENRYPEVYTLVARPGLERIAGIRLEALPDPSLPQHGPGRCTCGNFWLNELRVFSQGKLFPPEDVVVADDEAQEYGRIIDGRVDRIASWGKYQKPGEKHIAYVTTRITRSAEDEFKIELHFAKGVASRHNLGRFRVSVTSDPEAIAAERRRIPLQLNDSEMASLDLALAKAQALEGNAAAAVDAFAALLNRSDAQTDEAQIVAAAAPLPGVLEQLVDRATDNKKLQLMLARILAQRGQDRLAAKQLAEAVADLQKSRELFSSLGAGPAHWTVLTPTVIESRAGTTLTLQPDGSILASGASPDQERYLVVAPLPLARITAVRLEAIPHPSLPKGGSGRDVNGWGAVQELTIRKTRIGGPPAGVLVPMREISVSFSRDNKRAFQRGADGRFLTGWDMWPEVYRRQEAVFQIQDDAEPSNASALVFELSTGSGRGSKGTLGCFRISVTDGNAASAELVLKEGEFANVSLALAKAQVLGGKANDAVASFTEALALTTDGADKARIIAQAASLAESALDDEGKTSLRRRALEGMKTELASWTKQLESGTAQDLLSIIQAVNSWNDSSDLTVLRDPGALAQFPVELRQTWSRCWTDATALLTKAETGFRALPADQQFEAVRAALKRRNPGMDAQVERSIDGGRVVQVIVRAPGYRDLSPIRALNDLQQLQLHGAEVTDLSPLRGMGLANLWLYYTGVSDLSPLKGMKLRNLDITAAPQLSDLSPLAGMPLESLTIAYSRVDDLTPLIDMKLSYLNCDSSLVTDLSPLRNVPLTTLLIHNTRTVDLSPITGVPLTTLGMTNSNVSDLAVLRGMPITTLQMQGTLATDLSPLVDLPLKELRCDVQADRDSRFLRAIPTLRTINTKSAADFWKELDLPLVQRLPAVQRGGDQPASDAERLDFARVAFDQKQFAFAAQLWAEALARHPRLGDERPTQIRYHAARAAVLASAGQGHDNSPLDDAARVKLRQQALVWLEADLAAWVAALDSEAPADRAQVVRALAKWRQERDLAALRDDSALAALPVAEQQAWRALWANVDAATDRARALAQQAYERRLEAEPNNALAATQLVDFLLPPGAQWTVLKPVELQTAKGTKLEVQDDDSVFAEKLDPAKSDTYTLVLSSTLKGIRGLRLEALADSRLPNGGPGWGSGNFVLNELTLHVSPAGSPAQLRAVMLHRPVSNFSQDGWHVSGLTDGADSTGWAISPRGNRDHTAIVELADATGDGSPLRLIVGLAHRFADPNFALGRFRLAVTTDPLTLERDQRHLAVLNIADPWTRLAVAYAESGHHDAAVRFFDRVLTNAGSWASKKAILDYAAPYDELLMRLGQLRPDDLQVQLALARSLSVRGQAMFAEKPAEALASLQRAREIVARLVRPAVVWNVPAPIEMKSDSGAKLELQADGSVFVHSHTPPPTDVYTLVFPADLPGIAGLRLEALADPRLPNGGSGWVPGAGNFVLNELTLRADAADYLGRVKSIELWNATADFSQRDFDVGSAIDGNPATGWAIWPRVIEDHTAIFELAEPVGGPGASPLTIQLAFRHADPNYKLGRFRLAFTNDKVGLPFARVRQELATNEVSNLYVALAKAYAQQGQSDQILVTLTEAIELAAVRADRSRIISAAAEFAGVLEKLAERASQDAAFQAELARYLYDKGEKAPADAARANARALFEAQLQRDPQNPFLAAELADVLLIDSHWSILKPTEIRSEKGATLTLQPDLSLLASGTNPDQDSYRFIAQPGAKDILALRVEALPDASLPNSGPGRQGNYVLTELEVFHQENPARISAAKESFAQDGGFTAAHAVDRNNGSGWAIWPKAGQAHSAYFSFESPMHLADTETLRVHLHFGSNVRHTLGRFRLSVSDDPAAVVRAQQRLAAKTLVDPWARLAAAYHTSGDQAARDKLLERRPELHVSIGDLSAAEKNWEQAIAAYSKTITDETADVAALAKRAAAYAAAGNWKLAQSDWRRIVTQQPDQLPSAFAALRKAERWNEAVEFGLELARQQRKDIADDTVVWLDIAPVLMLADDEEAYARFCEFIAEKSAATTDVLVAERVVKAALLRPASIDMAKLPGDVLAKSLDDGTAPDGLLPWVWFARALWAYRQGDHASALTYAAKSDEHRPAEMLPLLEAMNMAVRAAVQHRLQHPDEARQALQGSAALISRFKVTAAGEYEQNLLIAQVLFREAEALITSQAKP